MFRWLFGSKSITSNALKHKPPPPIQLYYFEVSATVRNLIPGKLHFPKRIETASSGGEAKAQAMNEWGKIYSSSNGWYVEDIKATRCG